MGSGTAAPKISSGIVKIPDNVQLALSRWKFTDKQLQALWHLAQFLLYGGAKGGGKSVFLCRWAVLECASYWGNKVFLGRQRAVDFRTTTLSTFKRFIDPSLYIHKEQKKEIHLPWCNGQIDYGGLDDPDVINKFNSYECGAFGLDQGEECDPDQVGMLIGTLRLVLPDGNFPSYRVRLTANPAECYLRTEYLEEPTPGDPKTGKGQRVFIKALHTDNPFLPPDYIPNLREALKNRPTLLKAYIEGSWDNLAAIDLLIQPSWVSAAQRLKYTGRTIRRVVVNDPAGQGDDENVTYVMEQSDTGRVRIVDQHIEGFTPNAMDTARRLVATRRKWEANLIVIDASGLGWPIYCAIAEMKDDNEKDEPCYPYYGGSAEALPDPFKKRFVNLKSMAWFDGADMLRQGLVCLPNDTVLGGQLLWQRDIVLNELKHRVLTKKELKEARKRSPDRGETVIMGLHGLKLAPDLPDNQPKSKAELFWDAVKKDQARSNGGETEEDWSPVG